MTKVWIANNKYDADYTVFFVDNKCDERNADLVKGAKLVNNKWESNLKVFVVKNKYEAKILVTRQNFAK